LPDTFCFTIRIGSTSHSGMRRLILSTEVDSLNRK